MEIDLSRLSPEGEQFTGEEPASALAIDEAGTRADSGLRYTVRAQVVSGELIVQGRLAADVEFQCCRCAEPFSRAIEEKAFLATRELAENEESVDLTPEMRDAILLAFPSYPVCRPGCAGLCAQCGVNLNRGTCECRPVVDDRWGALDGWESNRGAAGTPGAQQ